MEQKKESLFNAGLAKLERIDTQKRMVQNARIMRNWQILSDALINIRNELNEWMNKIEITKADELENSMRNEINNYLRQKYMRSKNNFIDTSKFLEYDRYLGKIEQLYGMSMPTKASMGDSADE